MLFIIIYIKLYHHILSYTLLYMPCYIYAIYMLDQYSYKADEK